MKTISVNQLRDALMGISHAMPLNISALVDARPRKTGNPFAAVAKLSVVNGVTGFDYEASVNRQLGREEKETDFSAAARSWGKVVSPALVENKGEYYLRLKVESTRKPVYLTKRTARNAWIVTAKETVAPYLPPATHATNQGTDKEIVYRNYKLGSLVALSMNGERYRIRS
ncbi:MAG: hypothetical protein KGL39_52120 [Patescibacteria group bacterium]|nr:hypothetical protein [Patescibacteria group bacterium]